MSTRVQLRGDTTQNWTSTNPVLADREVGIERTISGVAKIKVGDGVTAWNTLPYFQTSAQTEQQAQDVVFIPTSLIGALNVQDAIEELSVEKANIQSIRTAGVVSQPTYQDNLDGTVTLGEGQYSLYSNTMYLGEPSTYTIQGGTFELVDNSANYILADYNNGNPQLVLITSVPSPGTTDSSRVPIISAYRYGTDISAFNWDNLGLGLAEKINQRLRRTDRFHIDNGLSLGENTNREVRVSAGSVWAGANLVSCNMADSSIAGTMHLYKHSNGQWVREPVSQYSNLQYDNGTNTQTVSNNKYVVNWVYRSVSTEGGIFLLLGSGDYSLIEAQSSAEPQKPDEIATQAVLVGRIIVGKNAATATQIDKVIDRTFGFSSAIQHNDLSEIQGGINGERWHLTTAELDAVQQIPSIALSVSQNTSSIGNVELAITGIEEDIQALQLADGSLSSAIGGLDNSVSSLAQNISALQSDVTSLQGADITFEAALSAVDSSITAINQNIASIEGEITALQSEDVSLGNAIAGVSSSLNSLSDTVTSLTQGVRGTKTVSSNYTAGVLDYTLRGDTTYNAVVISLPLSATCIGKLLVIKNVGDTANSVFITCQGGEVIDGVSSAEISTYNQSLTIQSNGTSWDIL